MLAQLHSTSGMESPEGKGENGCKEARGERSRQVKHILSRERGLDFG